MMDCRMNSELYRLETFSTWTSTVFFSVLSLARFGFYYSRKSDEVICFACGTRLSGWNANDDPLERHRRLAPDCPLVRGDATGNIPLKINHSDGKCPRNHATTDNAELEADHAVLQNAHLTKLYKGALNRARKKGLFSNGSGIQQDRSMPDFEKLRHEEERLLTFQNWPPSAKADPGALARAGFFYTGPGDRVQCAFCHGFIHTWLSSDIPEVEHKRHYLECRFVRGMEVGNVPVSNCRSGIEINEPLQRSIREGAAQPTLGQVQPLTEPRLTEAAKHPEYADAESRIQSLKNGTASPGQTAEGLADPRWSSTGPKDTVCCSQCGGTLRESEPDDDTCDEHKELCRNCRVIKTQRQIAQNQPAPQAAARVYQMGRREVKARMETATARAILDMGYSRDLVRMAIEKRLTTAGVDFPNAESLLEALFELEEAGTQAETPVIAQTPINAAETVSLSSARDSSVSSVSSSQSSIALHQPNTNFQPTFRSASPIDRPPAASFQSLNIASTEMPAASATVAAITGNQQLASGQLETESNFWSHHITNEN